MDWRNSLSGMLEVELTSAEPEAALCALAAGNTDIYRLYRSGDLSVCFLIRRSDLERVRQLAKRRGDSLWIVGKRGIYWRLRTLPGRPVLLFGIVLLLALTLLLPTRVLFIQVEGDQAVARHKILEAAQQSGLYLGTARRAIRSERIKNALLEQLPELEWAGVNTRGCVAVISVREKENAAEPPAASAVSSIVAARDGVIVSCTATAGNLLCTPGQTVTKGQLLISAYTDCGSHLQATRAQGEIYALTKHAFFAVSPATAGFRTRQIATKRRYGLLIGKKRINLWKDSGICPTTCGRMYEEYYITLPGGYSLPLALTVDTCVYWETTERELPSPDLSNFSRELLLEQLIAGQIHSGKEASATENGAHIFSGIYVCREMIGREKQEQMGEYYVENN